MSFEPTRREFLYQSVGLAAATRLGRAAAVTPRIWPGFPLYSQFSPKVPVWCVTPKLQGCLHRFFDTSPVSPSGRYLGVTRLRDETRMPAFGDAADIVVVDLTTGDTEVVAETRGFGTQLGAQVQWGATDQDLFYSDVDTEKWRVFTVHMNPFTRAKRTLNGPMYMVSPNGKQIVSPCLLRTELTQSGYGVVAPPTHLQLNSHADENDGVYLTDVESGQCRLLASFRKIVSALPEALAGPAYTGGAFYGFHAKWNPQGTRLMFILRYRPMQGGVNERTEGTANVCTLSPEGGDICLAFPGKLWRAGGNHPNWAPDGIHITMNFNLYGKGLLFVEYRYDGSDLRALSADIPGSGHPSLHVNGRFLMTDAYTWEPLAFGDGTTPIRWIDLRQNRAEAIIRIGTKPTYAGPMDGLRVDPHPAWDRSQTRVTFNACPKGYRQVFLADMSDLLS